MSIRISDHLTKEDADQIVWDTLKIVEPDAQKASVLFRSFSKLPTPELVAYAYELGRTEGKSELTGELKALMNQRVEALEKEGYHRIK